MEVAKSLENLLHNSAERLLPTAMVSMVLGVFSEFVEVFAINEVLHNVDVAGIF